MTTIYYPRWVPFAEALTISPSIVLIGLGIVLVSCVSLYIILTMTP